MKTNCNLRASLHSLISSTPTSNKTTGSGTTASGKVSRYSTGSAMTSDTTTGAPISSTMTSDTPTGSAMTINNTTDYPCITAVPCTGNCSSCCCAVLMLRFVAECSDDPAAFAEDARCLLKKYPLD